VVFYGIVKSGAFANAKARIREDHRRFSHALSLDLDGALLQLFPKMLPLPPSVQDSKIFLRRVQRKAVREPF
jgi:hypothetical protein